MHQRSTLKHLRDFIPIWIINAVIMCWYFRSRFQYKRHTLHQLILSIMHTQLPNTECVCVCSALYILLTLHIFIYYCARFAWQMFNLPAACYYNFFFCQTNNKLCAFVYDTDFFLFLFLFCILVCFSLLLFYIRLVVCVKSDCNLLEIPS